jgi:hypothetical protein
MNAKQPNCHLLLYLLLLLALTLLTASLAACNTATTSRTGPTAAERLHNGSPDANLAATAQADQYWRDAQATTVSQQATQEANYQNVRGTASAAQATQVAQTTRDALHLSLTVDAATVQANQTAEAATRSFEATATTQARADAQATATEAAAIVQASRTAQAEATADAATATRQFIADEQDRRQARRNQVVDALQITFGVLLIAALGGLLLYLLYLLLPTLVNRASLVRYGQHGNPLFITKRKGRVVLTDPLRMHQAALTVDDDGTVNMPTLTPDAIQTMLANGALRTLIEQARHAPGHAPILPSEVNRLRRLGLWTKHDIVRYDPGDPQQNLLTLQARTAPTGHDPDDPDELPLPTHVPWSLLASHAGDGVALGAGRGHQLITLDLARLPHLFVAGMSGAGKTRRLMRPLVAQALAAGYYAVLMNESGSDFAPFYDHPNVAIVRGDVRSYMAVIQAAMAEMERREAVLRQVRVSEWGRLPNQYFVHQPFVLLAIDELLALAATLTPKEQKQFWSLLTAFASRARKVGMCSLGLATDPTYRALGQGGLNYRSQCGRISFRMFQAAGSRAILDQNGAEQLEESHFLALLDRPGVQQGVAANPDDNELVSYLQVQTSREYQHPQWLPVLNAGRGTGRPISNLPPLRSNSGRVLGSGQDAGQSAGQGAGRDAGRGAGQHNGQGSGRDSGQDTGRRSSLVSGPAGSGGQAAHRHAAGSNPAPGGHANLGHHNAASRPTHGGRYAPQANPNVAGGNSASDGHANLSHHDPSSRPTHGGRYAPQANPNVAGSNSAPGDRATPNHHDPSSRPTHGGHYAPQANPNAAGGSPAPGGHATPNHHDPSSRPTHGGRYAPQANPNAAGSNPAPGGRATPNHQAAGNQTAPGSRHDPQASPTANANDPAPGSHAAINHQDTGSQTSPNHQATGSQTVHSGRYVPQAGPIANNNSPIPGNHTVANDHDTSSHPAPGSRYTPQSSPVAGNGDTTADNHNADHGSNSSGSNATEISNAGPDSTTAHTAHPTTNAPDTSPFDGSHPNPNHPQTTDDPAPGQDVAGHDPTTNHGPATNHGPIPTQDVARHGPTTNHEACHRSRPCSLAQDVTTHGPTTHHGPATDHGPIPSQDLTGHGPTTNHGPATNHSPIPTQDVTTHGPTTNHGPATDHSPIPTQDAARHGPTTNHHATNHHATDHHATANSFTPHGSYHFGSGYASHTHQPAPTPFNDQALDALLDDADALSYFAQSFPHNSGHNSGQNTDQRAGQRTGQQPNKYKTLNAILTAIEKDDKNFPGWNRNGEGFDRLKQALRLRAQEGCQWATSIRGFPWED